MNWNDLKDCWSLIVSIASIAIVATIIILFAGLVGDVMFSLANWLSKHMAKILICCALGVIIHYIVKRIE